ncbi:MAG: hypothetical protein HC865_19190 [Cyanobacteria bacterium RU_5_0]|nr:hypothetical protein [Cyanobacteria bacterium RU_5_0]
MATTWVCPVRSQRRGSARSMATTWGLFLLRCYCSSTIAVLMSHSGRSNVSGS